MKRRNAHPYFVALRQVEEGNEEQTVQVIDEPTEEENSLPQLVLEKQPQEETNVIQAPIATSETVVVDVVQPIAQVQFFLRMSKVV